MEIPAPKRTRAEIRAAAMAEHARRGALASRLAETHDGVVTRRMLLDAGLSRSQIRNEVDRGVWHRLGRHTISVIGPHPSGAARWWRALWESGERAVLDGTTALQAAGLTWKDDAVHVSIPHNSSVTPVPGVVLHRVRDLGRTTGAGLVRTRPEVAAIRAAQWASSDRKAATIIAMTIQQGLCTTDALLERWAAVGYSPRRALLDVVIRDVCAGAESMNELDFAALCRAHNLPEPTRQAVRTASNGRVYLDVLWEDVGLHVEIQGAQHMQGTAGIDDALRANDLAIRGTARISLQIPVLGLRLTPGKFMAQVARALVEASNRAA